MSCAYEPRHEKRNLRDENKQWKSRSASWDIQSDQDFCYTSLCPTVPSDSTSGQWRPWSDCADAQSDLGLRCPHMPEETFSHGAAHTYLALFKAVSFPIYKYWWYSFIVLSRLSFEMIYVQFSLHHYQDIRFINWEIIIWENHPLLYTRTRNAMTSLRISSF